VDRRHRVGSHLPSVAGNRRFQGIDFRAKRLGWAVAGFASPAILLLAPVQTLQTHAIKIDLPAAH
jgi:hypothetical protein